MLAGQIEKFEKLIAELTTSKQLAAVIDFIASLDAEDERHLMPIATDRLRTLADQAKNSLQPTLREV